MKKQVIAIVFSDLHLNIYAKFNENNKRTLNHFRVLSIIKEECERYSCPALFCGDLFHKPETLDSGLYKILCEQLDLLGKLNIYAISGNHCIKEISKIKEKPFSWLRLVREYGVQVWDYKSDCLSGSHKDFIIHGVPYIDHNIGLSDYLNKISLNPKLKHILLLHTDYPGAKDTDGREVGSVENLNLNVLNRFDLVLCGHIHKPQKLSKKVYMIGAPLQQRRTDRDCKLGYWKLFSDLSMTFVELKGFPRFIDVESQEEIKDDGNYYTILPKITSKPTENKHNITKQLTNKTLAKRYMKVKGIKDKNKEQLLIKVLKEADQ